ncbi:MAG TPA: aminopeptidase [Steroidobacteraceae bacterium]|nr:aminopeptidase [Steroidobacteraceae bacterium]
MSSLLRTLLAVACCLLLPGCYVLQAAHGEAQVLSRRQPISRVIADPHTPPKLRATLTQVLAARDFASRSLGLPDNRSYRLYADIGRKYVVWNVVAAPEFSLVPLHWCFPIVGCVAYRGYFKQQQAEHFAQQLRMRGDDVTIDDVPAYSTLGRFADPVLNTMLDYGDAELAGIIFHELAHQLIYVPGDSSFDEAFAVTVEQEGVRRWLLLNDRVQDLRRYEESAARQLQYLALFRRYRAQLAHLYASGLPAAPMRARKRAILASLAGEMRALGERLHAPHAYEDWLEQGLNNADLASLATYYDCVPGFQRMLAQQHGDLQRFYQAVRELARLPQRERDAAVCTTPSG